MYLELFFQIFLALRNNNINKIMFKIKRIKYT